MKSGDSGNSISLTDALHIFWDWRLASISVEICFFGKSKSSETLRVSIDGLVSLVDPEGIVTVSGDGREIELDLRGCRFARARQPAGNPEIFDSLDPDSILQINFPNGEICLVFPYRRVAHPIAGQRRAETGLEWLRNKISSSAGPSARPFGAGPVQAPATGKPRKRAKSGPRLVHLAGLVIAVLVLALGIAPLGVTTLLREIGIGQAALSAPELPVWVIPQEGNYYCSGGALFGTRPGRFMKQADALTLGYQPATGRYCTAALSAVASRGQRGYFRGLLRGDRLVLSLVLDRSRCWLGRSYPQIANLFPFPAALLEQARIARRPVRPRSSAAVPPAPSGSPLPSAPPSLDH
jgi:hypothetical protein